MSADSPDAELPQRVRRAEERRAFRELLAKSSLGCPTGDCDHHIGDHVADKWENDWPTVNPRCTVTGCPCPVETR